MKNHRTLSRLALATVMTIAAACSSKVYKSENGSAIEISAVPTANPIFVRMETNPYLRMKVDVDAGTSFLKLKGAIVEGDWQDISRLEVYEQSFVDNKEANTLLGSAELSGKRFEIPLKAFLEKGNHVLWLSITLKDNADTDKRLSLKVDQLSSLNANYRISYKDLEPRYLGTAIRKPKDEGVHTYRIPGIITTDKGTLISVYDIRYDNSRDLPANIDVGMSRSTDGGNTWDAMKNIMDMEGPNDNSGVGDPSILFDPVTKTIWVSALWSKGNNSIAGSGPGLTPEETGQFVLTYSTDDGLTWAKPYTITPQVKNPEWRLFFPGPGNGIAMKDGKLVFPAQYWDAQKMPHSTLIYSADHGKTWKSGVGAKSNTTESQLVETTSGTIMLNMRDNRGMFRSVATTTDLGKTWTTHATSYNTLSDPVCMASFIKANVSVGNTIKDVLFFSNQNDPKMRVNFTIKASMNLGESWPSAHQLQIDERRSYGYSALTKIDDHHVGALYEGNGSLLFVKIPVVDIIK